MRLLFCSNSPWASTGYGVQTRLVVPRLAALGHELAVASTYGFDGALLTWCGYTLYPRGREPYSQDILAAHSAHFNADATLTLFDAWVAQPHRYRGMRWVPWVPVDADPLPAPVADAVRHAVQPIVFSRFGERVARAAGLDVRYVPLVVDTRVYRPRPRADARREAGLPDDRFIVGMVADNKDTSDRKAFAAQLAGFAAFRRSHPDALLYMHTNLGIDGRGIDVSALCDALGLTWSMLPDADPRAAVVVCDQYTHLLGHTDAQMAAIYASLDVLLMASAWEAFGVPLIEAQACGVPVITSGWTSMPELVSAGWIIDAQDAELRVDGLRGVVRHPRAVAVTAALTQARATSVERIARATEYDVDHVASEYWRPVLDELAARLATTPRTFAEALRA